MSSDKSVHSAGVEEIHLMPVSEIIRPIPSELDDRKVESIADILKVKKNNYNRRVEELIEVKFRNPTDEL